MASFDGSIDDVDQIENLEDFIEFVSHKTSDNGETLRKLSEEMIREFNGHVERICERSIKDAVDNEDLKIEQIERKREVILNNIEFMKHSVLSRMPNFDINEFQRDETYLDEVLLTQSQLSPRFNCERFEEEMRAANVGRNFADLVEWRDQAKQYDPRINKFIQRFGDDRGDQTDSALSSGRAACFFK